MPVSHEETAGETAKEVPGIWSPVLRRGQTVLRRSEQNPNKPLLGRPVQKKVWLDHLAVGFAHVAFCFN